MGGVSMSSLTQNEWLTIAVILVCFAFAWGSQ